VGREGREGRNADVVDSHRLDQFLFRRSGDLWLPEGARLWRQSSTYEPLERAEMRALFAPDIQRSANRFTAPTQPDKQGKPRGAQVWGQSPI
jgi:hypothetical protein